ncbi:MAG: YraN family protein [Candidatus Dormibacteraceae bacterium]
MGAIPPAAGDLNHRRRLGAAGERVAAAHLERLGYRVVGSGFLARKGEIDLVCRRGEELVLVEVKTRSSTAFGTPAEAVDERKRRALTAAAAEYRALAGWRGPIAYAVFALVLGADGEVRSSQLIPDPF